MTPRSNVVAIEHATGAAYPRTSDYGPDPAWREVDVASSGEVSLPYELVRMALQHAGCDLANAGSAAWSPFSDFLDRGKRVHVLPNFVANRRSHEADPHSFYAKVTHASVLQPVIDYALKAAGAAELVTVGNASIQGCDFDGVISETGMRALIDGYYARRGIPINLVDLRGLRTEWSRIGALLSSEQTAEETIEVDLGADSLLDELYSDHREPRFRVGDYAEAATGAYHSRGRHVYAVNRRVLDADLVISVPKLKAHEKVGLTCALKGTVGTVTRKECLAHHRPGSPDRGGDEFPHDTILRRATSRMLGYSSAEDATAYSNGVRVIAKTAFRGFRALAPGTMDGAWSGNDTAWRMALDIARVVLYARPDGTLAAVPQRKHIAVVDGIVSGEGNGPLRPSPRDTGAIIFGSDACLVDAAASIVMGWDPARLPIVRESFARRPYALTDQSLSDLQLLLDGRPSSVQSVGAAFQPRHVPPTGWAGVLAQ